MDIESFRNPDSKFRPAPFWSWNDALEDEELVRQIGLMEEAGWGGFFMHSRVGLLTPYLTNEWMSHIQTCVREAKRRGMCAYLYDEDKWPSGFAGGFVPAADPDFRAKALCYKVDNKPTNMSEALARFVAEWEDDKLVNVHRVDDLFAVPNAQVFLTFYPTTASLGNDWFQGYTYVDLLNPRAVQAFIKSTYEAYYEKVGEEFGKTVPGIFTDEPCYLFASLFAGHRGRVQNVAPWTTGFDSYFREKRGYDLLEVLPSVFFDVGDFHKVRYDFWRTATERFIEAFSKPMYKWCQEHNIAFTGHYMAEDTLESQILWIGAAMPHYQYMQYPGIDKLGRHIEQIATCKQVSSVADQLGWERCLCEAYGCNGQDFSFRGRKWIGDWLYALGINLMNPHLALYSMRGERKRDYPANLFYQQPWWDYNAYVGDYYARLSYALSQGERQVDLLVIHPIGSAWTMYRPDGSQTLVEYDREFALLCRYLLETHQDYHFGDEMVMESHAKIDGNRLRVGKQSYSTVLVPPSVTLAENTVRLLEEFARVGGCIIALRPLPTRVDGKLVGQVLPDATIVVGTLAEAVELLQEHVEVPITLTGSPSVWYHYRVNGNQHIIFLANTSDEEQVIATLAVSATGLLQEWDPLTGAIEALAVEQSNGETVVTVEFPPSGSHLLVLDTGFAYSESEQERFTPVAEEKTSGTWALSLMDENALTLDTVRLKLGDEPWTDSLHVLDASDAISSRGLGTAFQVAYDFLVAEMPEGPVHLALETPEAYHQIIVNGKPAPTKTDSYWADISFKRLDITAYCHPGRNEVILSGTYGPHTEIEACYVTGNFGVSAEYSGSQKTLAGQTFRSYAPRFIITRPSKEGDSNLVERGLPFYAGRVKLRNTFHLPGLAELVVLELDSLNATVASVTVNGVEIGEVFWPPYEVDITSECRVGENELEITLVNSLRNLLGPHHQCGGDGHSVGPGSFRDKANWTNDYWLVPFGLGQARITLYEKEQL